MPGDFPLVFPYTFDGSSGGAFGSTEYPRDGFVGSPLPDHTAKAIKHLALHLRKPFIEKLVQLFNEELNEIETALYDLVRLRQIETATFAQLDVLGQIIGLQRQGLDDESYRIGLKAQLLVNRSSGGPEEIYAIFNAGFPQLNVRYRPEYPAGFTLTLSGGPLSDTHSQLAVKFIQSATAGGVRAVLQWQQYEDSEMLTLLTAGGTSTSSGLGYGHLGNAAEN